jgi:hypothetical protein
VTGRVFWHLRFFVCSLVHNSDTRFRLVANGGEIETPSWAVYHGMAPLLAVTRYTSALLRGLVERTPRPELPPGLDPALEQALLFVRDEIVDLVERYRACMGRPVGAWG